MENEFNETQTRMIKTHSTFKTKNEPLQNQVKRSIENGRETRFHYERVINFEDCLMLFSMINILLTVLYYDADSKGKQFVSIICLYYIFATLILQVIVTVFRYFAQIVLEKSQKILDSEQTIITSGKLYIMLLEIFVLLLQPYPFMNDLSIETQNVYDGFSFQFKINYLLVLFGFLKTFIIVRGFLKKRIYMSPRSSRLCRMYGCQSDYLYAIKCLFKDNPMSLIGIVFLISILLFSLSLRICQGQLNIQYPKNKNGEANPQNIQNFLNAVWLTIITMTTVGYGDFYPRTIFGRCVDLLLVVWGTFIVSLMVVVLTNTLNMDQSQKRALIVLNRLEAKKSLKQSAAYLITHSCRKYLIRKQINQGKRPPLSLDQQQKMDNSFYKYLTNFQNVHRVIRSMYEIDDVYEQMTRQFEFINDQINFLLNSQEETITNLKNYLQQNKSKTQMDQDSEDQLDDIEVQQIGDI